MLAAFLQGFHYTYLMAAVLCLVGAALSARCACLIDNAKKDTTTRLQCAENSI